MSVLADFVCIASLFMSQGDVYAAALRLREVVTVMLEAGCVGPPVFVHFDEELEEDLLLEEILDILACLGADALEGRTGFADDDTLLRVALAVDDGVDADEFVLFLEGLHLDLDRIRDLLVVVEEDLLPDDLINEEACGFVGQLVLGEERRSDGQGFFDSIEELGDAETLLCGDGEDLCLGELGMPEGYEGLEGLLGREVDLIYNKEHARTRGGHLLDFVDKVGIAVDGVLGFGDVEEDIGVNECRTAELQHFLLEAVVRRKYSRGIGIDHLEVLAVNDTENTMTGRLRLRSDNREALAHQGVHQRRFAHIGVAHYIYESASMLHIIIF